MTPTRLFLWLAGGWIVLGLVASFVPALVGLWTVIGLVVGLIAALDLILARLGVTPELDRTLPGRFALGTEAEVSLSVGNSGRRNLHLQLHEGLPPIAESDSFPITFDLAGGHDKDITYFCRYLVRGAVNLNQAYVRLRSPLRLWWRGLRIGKEETVHVYPDYEPVLQFALLAMEHQESTMGIVQKRSRGASREFHQLREYQEGDSLKQIDWKATARSCQLVAREYREEKDQCVILLIDAGRRMRSLDGSVSQFDHCINAALLLSYIALRQGDHVGIQCFSGQDRWLPPVKGATAMPRVLNHLYDLQTTMAPSDFSEAAHQVLARQKRRALVILLTNLRGDDDTELLPAMQLLRRKHVLLVASLREKDLDDRSREDPTTFGKTLDVCSIRGYFERRRKVTENLAAQRVMVVDSVAQELPVALVNGYLDVKRRGLL